MAVGARLTFALCLVCLRLLSGNCSTRPEEFEAADPNLARADAETTPTHTERWKGTAAISQVAPSSTHAHATSSIGGVSSQGGAVSSNYPSERATVVVDLARLPFVSEKPPPSSTSRYTLAALTAADKAPALPPDARSRNVPRLPPASKPGGAGRALELSLHLGEGPSPLDTSPSHKGPSQAPGEFLGTSPGRSNAHTPLGRDRVRASSFQQAASKPRQSASPTPIVDPHRRAHLMHPTFDTTFFIPDMLAKHATPAESLAAATLAAAAAAAASTDAAASGVPSSSNPSPAPPSSRPLLASSSAADLHHVLSRNVPRGGTHQLALVSGVPTFDMGEIIATSLALDRHDRRMAHRVRGVEPRSWVDVELKTIHLAHRDRTSSHSASGSSGEGESGDNGGGVQFGLISSGESSQTRRGESPESCATMARDPPELLSAASLSNLHATTSSSSATTRSTHQVAFETSAHASRVHHPFSTGAATAAASSESPHQSSHQHRSPVLGSIQARKKKRDADAAAADAAATRKVRAMEPAHEDDDTLFQIAVQHAVQLQASACSEEAALSAEDAWSRRESFQVPPTVIGVHRSFSRNGRTGGATSGALSPTSMHRYEEHAADRL